MKKMLVFKEKRIQFNKENERNSNLRVLKNDGWRTIRTAPKEIPILVYLPEGRRSKYEVAILGEEVSIVGGKFSWDMPEFTHWRPINEKL